MKTTTVRDPVLAVYLEDVDLSLLRENLKLTPGQRLEKFVRFAGFASTLRAAGQRHRARHSRRFRR